MVYGSTRNLDSWFPTTWESYLCNFSCSFCTSMLSVDGSIDWKKPNSIQIYLCGIRKSIASARIHYYRIRKDPHKTGSGKASVEVCFESLRFGSLRLIPCKFLCKCQFIKFDQRKEAFVHDTMTYGTWHLNPYHTLEVFGRNIFGDEEHLLFWISFRFWDFLRLRQEQQEQLQIPLHIFLASPLNLLTHHTEEKHIQRSRLRRKHPVQVSWIITTRRSLDHPCLKSKAWKNLL